MAGFSLGVAGVGAWGGGRKKEMGKHTQHNRDVDDEEDEVEEVEFAGKDRGWCGFGRGSRSGGGGVGGGG